MLTLTRWMRRGLLCMAMLALAGCAAQRRVAQPNGAASLAGSNSRAYASL